MSSILNIRTFRLIPLKAFALLILSAIFFGSCLKVKKEEPDLQSAVNIVNATIGMPPITFFINKTFIQGVPMKYTNESGYFITFPGTREFDVAAEAIPGYIFSTVFSFKQNTNHTIFITGERTSINTLFTDDDLSNPPSGKSKMRFVNLSPDAGDLILAIKNEANLFPQQAYRTVSQFMTINPGGYDFQLKTATGYVLLNKNVTIAPGMIYTIWANGMRSGTSNSPLDLQLRSIN